MSGGSNARRDRWLPGYACQMTEEPREHGNILGRGDKLGGDAQQPPMAHTPSAMRIPGCNARPILH
jgi:hypothetical protein